MATRGEFYMPVANMTPTTQGAGIVTALLAAGAKINVLGSNGQTNLHKVAGIGVEMIDETPLERCALMLLE